MTSHREISIVGLVQVLVILAGWFAISVQMKALGYPDGGEMIRWNPAALFVREKVYIVLLVPIAWTVFAIVGEFSARFALSKWTTLSVGIALILGLATFLIWTFSNVGLRPTILPNS